MMLGTDDIHTRGPLLTFGAHKTYHVREQWLTKGLLAVHAAESAGTAASHIFAHPYASDTFGIGPGMVRALRFWMKATGLMCEQRQHGRSLPTLTPLGKLVVQYDPYLERLGSVWLLHIHLARNLLLAPTWYWFFQRYQGWARFTRQEALEALLPWTIAVAEAQVVRKQALQQDLACLLRMYVPDRLLGSPAVLTTSPFQRLGIVRYLPDKPGRCGCYGCQSPQTEEIPSLVFLTALLLQAETGPTFPFSALLNAPLHAGRTLLLSSDGMIDLLMRVQHEVPEWSPTWEKGQVRLPWVEVSQVMRRYYTQSPPS